MKVVILAGGLGTRLSEETDRIPKPMVTIGLKPILWHIMKIYSHYGLNDFILCTGYKSSSIIEYFVNYRLYNSNVTINLEKNTIDYLGKSLEPWKVTIIDTGEKTQTGGRLLRVRDYLSPEESFCMTYGDGLSDVNIFDLIKFHKNNKYRCTLTAVQPPSRFGTVDVKRGTVISFSEKPVSGEGMINGGFFVLEPSIFDLLENDDTVWEHSPLEALTSSRTLGAFVHKGFWHPMDTLRDRRFLENLWISNTAPWKCWPN